jgi:hypothetical protein
MSYDRKYSKQYTSLGGIFLSWTMYNTCYLSLIDPTYKYMTIECFWLHVIPESIKYWMSNDIKYSEEGTSVT